MGKPAKCRQQRVVEGHLGTMWLGRGATCEESCSCNWSVIRVFSGSQRKNRRKARVAFNRGQRAAMVGRDSGMQVRQPPGACLLDNLATRSKAHHSLYAFYWDSRWWDFHFSTSVLTSARILPPVLPRAGPQHCVGPGTTPAGCDDFCNVTRPDKLPKNWSRLRKVSADMVPMLPGLVGAPLCNACYNTLLKGTATKRHTELPAAGDLLCTRNVAFVRTRF